MKHLGLYSLLRSWCRGNGKNWVFIFQEHLKGKIPKSRIVLVQNQTRSESVICADNKGIGAPQQSCTLLLFPSAREHHVFPLGRGVGAPSVGLTMGCSASALHQRLRVSSGLPWYRGLGESGYFSFKALIPFPCILK